MSEPFIAEVRIFALNFAPRGWAFCNGQLLPIAQNTALFSLVGTTYGGDGETTLGLPNLQGRAPMHPGNGPGLTSRRLGQVGGTQTETLTEGQMPAHSHTIEVVDGPANTDTPSEVTRLARTTTELYGPDQDLEDMGDPVIGGGQAHDNMQPYLALNFCIALTGLFPSRS